MPTRTIAPDLAQIIQDLEAAKLSALLARVQLTDVRREHPEISGGDQTYICTKIDQAYTALDFALGALRTVTA